MHLYQVHCTLLLYMATLHHSFSSFQRKLCFLSSLNNPSANRQIKIISCFVQVYIDHLHNAPLIKKSSEIINISLLVRLNGYNLSVGLQDTGQFRGQYSGAPGAAGGPVCAGSCRDSEGSGTAGRHCASGCG